MPERVFLVGAPRSGTTWLQQMLGAHREIATPQESDLFDGYLAPWRALWERQLPTDPEEWRRRRHKGLPAVLTEDGFDALLRGVVEHVHGEVLRLKPGARVVLEKVPGYALQAPLILRLLPEARFVHLVRDGRDVAASLVRASRGWGAAWAPGSMRRAAALWREHVEAARSIAALTPRYAEVRYEELLADAPGRLAELFASCGVEPADCEAIAARHARGASGSSLVWGGEVARRLVGAPPEPDGFEGTPRTRPRLSPRERRAVRAVAGPLLVELGYEGGS